MDYSRSLKDHLERALLKSHKITLLYGARQTGKTTLINEVIKGLPYRSLSINADEIRFIDTLSSRDLNRMKLLVEGYDLLFIDEAQRIPDAGINIKILHDGMPNLKIIISGSSSLELANKTKEPLTGRLDSYVLYPMAWNELKNDYNSFELTSKLDEFLVYGSYPDILNIGNSLEKQKQLIELSSSYLFKDILELSNIRHSRKLVDLLRLLSFQVGSQVSLTELGSSLGMSKETVASYIDLLEKSFVLFRLGGYSNNFSPLNMRNDTGQRWENY